MAGGGEFMAAILYPGRFFQIRSESIDEWSAAAMTVVRNHSANSAA